MAHQKPPEAPPSLTFSLSYETANTLIHHAKRNHCRTSSKPLSSINYFTLLERKIPQHNCTNTNSPQILQSCVIASELCYHTAILIHIKDLPIIIFILLTLEFCLQLSPGLVLHKGSHSYITKLKHCVASYTLHLPQHVGSFVPVHWAETII